MTDSTIDENSGDGGFDVGASADDLFGAIADELNEGAVDRDSTDATADAEANAKSGAGGVEDQTASNVFGKLKAEAEVVSPADGTDDVLEGESPEDIIASADEPDPEPESTVDDDLLVDEEELEDLLLTGRTKDQEFLWIDPDGSPADEVSDGATDVDFDAEETGQAEDETVSDLFDESVPDDLEADAEPRESESEINPGPEPRESESELDSEAETAAGIEADTGPETDPEPEPSEPSASGADSPADAESAATDSENEDEDEPEPSGGLVIADKPAGSGSSSAAESTDAASGSRSEADRTPDATDESAGLLGRLRSVLSLLLS